MTILPTLLGEDERLLIEAYRKGSPVLKKNMLRRTKELTATGKLPFAAKFRKELKRLDLKQSELMHGTEKEKHQNLRELMRGHPNHTLDLLKCLAWGGMDVNFLITGNYQAGGVGVAALHQSVLEAIDLLSLGEKVNALQLAQAVNKLSYKHRRTGGILPVTSLFEQASKGVVQVYKHAGAKDAAKKMRKATGYGSGTVIGDGTIVLTCAHCVEECKSVSVHVNGSDYSTPGEIIYTDTLNDLALIKVARKVGAPITLNWKLSAMVGDGAVIIGYPFNSSHVSLVSAHISSQSGTQYRLDATVNKGHSGSPLLNLSGEVIGIVCQKKDSLPELLDELDKTEADINKPKDMFRKLIVLEHKSREIRENLAYGMGVASSIEALIEGVGKAKLRKMVNA
jgi:hypothetical protein